MHQLRDALSQIEGGWTLNLPLPIRVVGVGSPNGDDALAWHVVQQLQATDGVPKDIEFQNVDGGQRLLDLLDGHGTLVLVDALFGRGRPGSIHRFEWPAQRLESMRPGSTHNLRPAEVLELAGALALLPPRVIIYGIEIDNADPAPGLSPCVLNAVDNLTRQIADELAGRRGPAPDAPVNKGL